MNESNHLLLAHLRQILDLPAQITYLNLEMEMGSPPKLTVSSIPALLVDADEPDEPDIIPF